jgi:F0F1-type ATP synthase membrane subunit b/b'
MSAEEITDSVETIETEAEKILEEARKQASGIILKARDEAGQIASAELSLKEIGKEQEQTISAARKQADREIEDAKKRAAGIRGTAVKKTGKIVERMVTIVTGAEAE